MEELREGSAEVEESIMYRGAKGRVGGSEKDEVVQDVAHRCDMEPGHADPLESRR